MTSLIGKTLWSPKKRSTAIILREEGYTFQQIAEKIGGGATVSGVYKVCKKFLNFKTINDLKGRGRKKCTTPQDDRRIVRLALQGVQWDKAHRNWTSAQWAGPSRGGDRGYKITRARLWIKGPVVKKKCLLDMKIRSYIRR